MKKILGIVLGIFAATIVAAILFYQIRKNKSMDQYVYKDSKSILAVAVDDLLIDHIGEFLRTRKDDSTATAKTKPSVWKDLWNAGVHIPAHIFLINLSDEPQAFYSMLTISNPDAWKRFLLRYAADSASVEDRYGEGLPIKINAYISVWSVDKQLYIRVSNETEAAEKPFPAAIADKSNWIIIDETPAFDPALLKSHLSYWTSDNNLQLRATVGENRTQIAGMWKPAHSANSSAGLRSLALDSSALVFRSALPTLNAQIAQTILNRFSEQENTNLIADDIDYIDVQVHNKLVVQEDSIISYDYDENFNTVEKIAVQQTNVPLIESVWKGTSALHKQLPEKLFYIFNRAAQDSLVLLSTATSPSASNLSFTPSDTVVQVDVDFTQWPSTWALGPFKTLQNQSVKLKTEMTRDSSAYIKISGHIIYPEIARW